MFRDYVNNNGNNVDILYKNMYENQNYKEKKHIISKLKYDKKYKIKDLFLLLNKVIDSSDPDTDVVQTDHCYETAQAIKNNYFIDNNLKEINIIDLFTKEDWFLLDEKYKKMYDTTINKLYKDIKDWSWLILVGLIHDLGKVLVLEEFGKFNEWFSVGDIYPLGCEFHKSNIFYEKNYHKQSIDYNNSRYNTSLGIYDYKVGFDNIEMTFSHDYYLSECLRRSETNLPYEALYIIRYHSFYSWHTPKNNIRGYEYLANETDWKYLPLLKLFQKSDLYSKKNDFNKNFDVDYFDNLIDKYIIGPINM